ncbi:hypothetical protein K3727_05565 [Rhodobacteraceae bacterium M382]|nr:hypothetical protein K3727_05565 [Rhodobacteraceae bacterium M382]
MKRLAVAMIMSLAVFGLPEAGTAKSLSRMLATSGLSPEDLDAMGGASRSLYAAAGTAIGATATWNNPKTGSHGVVKLEKRSGSCATLLHSTYPNGREQGLPLRTRQCQGADGTWQLQP